MAKILLHSLLFSPDATANSYIFSDLAIELQKLGHEVSVITTTPHYGVLKENIQKQPLLKGKNKWYKISDFHNGIKCMHIVVPTEKGGMKQRAITYVKFHHYAQKLVKIEEIKADIVISQSPPLTIGLVGAKIAKKLKAKSVYVVQDLFPDGPIEQGKIKNKALIWILRKLEKKVYRKNSALVAISEGIQKNLSKRVPKGKNVTLIPNFVNTEIYRPHPYDIEYSEAHQLQGKFVISYVGNIGNAHDLSPLIEAAVSLRDRNIEFLIAGNGIKQKYYEDMAREKHAENIRFLGYVQREETVKINSVSDLCLVMLASHVKGTSFPSKIYTLMGMKKPILLMSSKECDASNFVEKNGIGVFVENGDTDGFISKIKELCNDSNRLEEFGKRGLDLVIKEYSKEKIGDCYDILIKQLLEKNL